MTTPILAPDHQGMRVSYQGLLFAVAHELSPTSPGHAEMVRQLQDHLEELGRRYYAGDLAVVDEFLQLYCIEKPARDALIESSSQKGNP